MLGFIYFEAGQTSFAKNFYEQALQINPNYVVALNNLAKIYEEVKDLKKAESLYDKVLTLNLNNKTANRRKDFIAKTKKHLILFVIGIAGFEPATSCSQSRRATKLRYIP